MPLTLYDTVISINPGSMAFDFTAPAPNLGEKVCGGRPEADECRRGTNEQ
jgi:hypothetical protein